MFTRLIKTIFNTFINNRNEMNDKSNERVEQLIPHFVGHYIEKSDEKLVKIIEIDSETDQTLVERRICNFFKCTKSFLNGNSGENGVKCFATRNTEILFFKHLNESHPNEELYCVYCYPNVDDKTCIKTYSHRYLVKHMLKRHRFRRFQCNQCLYRAITEDHVYIHQSITHKTSNELNSNELKCKIFKCLPINAENSVPNVYYYYNKFKTERFNTDGKNETLFQCLYCDFMDENVRQVCEHCVQRHLDYPIMYFIPEPQISSSTHCRANDYLNISINNTVIQSVQPKTEPQDNSVSSTSPLKISSKVDESEDKLSSDKMEIQIDCNKSSDKRKLLSDECENAVNETIKKMKVCEQKTNDSSVKSLICDHTFKGTETIDKSDEHKTKSILNSDNNKEKRGENSQKIICLFCDELFIDGADATNHLISHFPEIVEAIDDYSVTKLVHQWIQQFILKQSQLSSYENHSKRIDNDFYYRCPLCVKLSLINKRIAKQYKSFNEVKTHLWQHCCWLSVKCKVCNVLLPNCSSLIARHLNDCHHVLLALPKNENLRFLSENEPEIDFTAQQRLQLQESFITFTNDRVIDPFINGLLMKMREEYEQHLRVIHNCHRFRVEVRVNRLPKLDFNNRNMVKKYFQEWKREENRLKNLNIKKKANNESNDETITPKKRVRFSDVVLNVNHNEKCVHRRKCDSIESVCDKAIHCESNNYHKNNALINEDMNSLGKDIEKVYDKVICFENIEREVEKNIEKRVELSENKKDSKTSHSMIECVASTSRDRSSEATTTGPEMLADINVAQNSSLINDPDCYRISCYHCNDKFRNFKEFREHHRKQHQRLVMRCFGKERIRPKSLINDK